MPLTTVLANAAPGSVGSVIWRPPPEAPPVLRPVASPPPAREERTRGTQGR